MAELIKVNAPVRKPLFEGVQGENESRSIQFDITPWVEELGDGAVTATAKRSQDSQPYPVTVTKDGTTVTWKPTSTDTAFAGVGSFQLEYTVDSVLAKTCIWSTMVAPSLDPAGDPPDPYDNWLAEMRQIAADALQDAQDADASAKTSEAWAVGQRGGVDVPSTNPTYENNSKYWAEQSLANQYGAFIVKSASGEIASFSDGADNVPMKSVKVTIVPKQAGSGDPSPSNVRPITGWTDADVHVQSNLFDVFTWGENTVNQRFYSVDSNGFITVTASDASGVSARLMNLKAGTRLKVVYNGFSDVRIFDSNGSGDYTFSNFVVPSDGKIAIKFYATSYPTTGWAMIVPYESTVTEYEPYTGHTTPVPLGQTVYGANGDAVSGAWEKTKNVADLGSLSWAYNSTYGVFIATFPNDSQPVTSTGRDAMCERYTAQLGGTLEALQNGKFLFNSTQISSGARLAIKDTAYTDAAVFKTAMNGVKFVYDLATPTDFTTTPVNVPSILGTNNVWADCGSVEVEYRADPTLAYAELEALILENL